MDLKSPEFEGGDAIPEVYTCDGENINPPLEIMEIPQGTKSFVLTMTDPDASNGTFVHWLLWDISPITTEIEEDSPPLEAITGKNSMGETTYLGPCPPRGEEHRYFFNLYALDKQLRIAEDAKIKKIETAMEGHVLAEAQLVGKYSRNLQP